MAARPRQKSTANLPEHVYFDPRYGTYRIKLANGKFKSLGHYRDLAVAIAKEYNRVTRPTVSMKVDDLILHGSFTNEKPFSAHIPALLKRIFIDEQPSDEFKKTMENDALRVQTFFAQIPGSRIGLQHVNDYINTYHEDASANVQNRKVAWLKKLFSYAVDESIMEINPAQLKKKRRVASKQRQRLKTEWYDAIHAAAPLWLQTAMDLSLQTTHARLEISRIKYKISKPTEAVCGCYWFKAPEKTQVGFVYGTLYIHRQKVAEKEAAHVAIPIGETLKKIIDRSRDNLVSDYVVHRLPKQSRDKLSKDMKHVTQLHPDYISRSFSKIRDLVGCCNHLKPEQRPTFHEIRALAAFTFKTNGIDPQTRMAHTDAESTKIYTENHVDWVHVPFAEINTEGW